MDDTSNMIVADTPQKIEAFRLLALKSALRLEIAGMKRSRGPSACAIIKSEFGLKGNKQYVMIQYLDILRTMGFPV